MLLGELGFIGIFIGGGAFAELVVDAPEFHYSDVPEWGALLSNVRLYARAYVWTALYPALAFFVAILGFNLAGEGLRKIVDRGGLRLNWLFNRYVLLGLVLAVTGVGRLATNGGATAFYRERRASSTAGLRWSMYAGWGMRRVPAERSGPRVSVQVLITLPTSSRCWDCSGARMPATSKRARASICNWTRCRSCRSMMAAIPCTIGTISPNSPGLSASTARAAGRVHVLAAGDIAGSRTGFSSQLPRPLRDLVLDDAVLLLFDPDDVLRFSRLAYRGMLVVVEDDADLARVRTLRGATRPIPTSADGPPARRRLCWPSARPRPIDCWAPPVSRWPLCAGAWPSPAG